MKHEIPNISLEKSPCAGDRESRNCAFITKQKRREIIEKV